MPMNYLRYVHVHSLRESSPLLLLLLLLMLLSSRVSFRVLLSRDFSRLPQMESFLAGYYVPLVNKSIPGVS